MLQKTSSESRASRRVSFIITTRNRAEYLRKCLERCRELVSAEDELIVIDGLSTDNTGEVVEKYSGMINVFISEPDSSGAHALNKGVLIARGKYIKQLPDDDIIYPEGMTRAIRVMEEHPEIDILYCGGTRKAGERVSTICLSPGVNYGKSTEDVFRYGATGIGFIYRRSSFSKIGLLHPTDLAADNEIILRAIKQGANVKFCRINLFYHPIINLSVTTSQRRKWQTDRYRLIREYCSFKFYLWYRWVRPLRLYYLNRWWKRRFLPWLLALPGVHRAARALRDMMKKILFRKTAVSDIKPTEKNAADNSSIWDGGFS